MAEQRKHPRFTCHGGVELQVKGTHLRTWGNVSDISRAGCYMETAEPWEIAVEAEFRIEIGAQEVYGMAVIVTSHPGVGMGLNFKEIYPQYAPGFEAILSSFGAPSDAAAGA